MKSVGKKIVGTFREIPSKQAELLVTARLRVGKFTSILKIFDFIHSLLELNDVPRYFKDRDDLQKSQNNFYILIISFLFSLFDPKGTDIRNLTLIVKSKDTKELLSQISNDWQILEPQITRIRHNLGFHSGGFPQLDNGYKAFEEIAQKGLILLAGIIKKIELLDDVLEQEIKNRPISASGQAAQARSSRK